MLLKNSEELSAASVCFEISYENPQEVLNVVVSADKTMILSHGALSKRDSIEWHLKGEESPKNAEVA